MFTEQADVWSAGIICYRLFTGTRPWSITAKRKFQEDVMKKMLDITKADWPSYIPKEARDVILASCRWEAEKRATAAESNHHERYHEIHEILIMSFEFPVVPWGRWKYDNGYEYD